VRRSRPLVLCYHAVSASWTHPLSISPRLFKRQVESLLRRGYVPCSASDAMAGTRRSLHVTFDDAFRSVSAGVDVLERFGVPATVFVCAACGDDGSPPPVPELAAEVEAHPDELATMTWGELGALAERGVEVASHTATHPHLPELSSVELDRELQGSRERIEDELRRPCRFLAYPFGEEDARVRAAARRAGYEAAFALSTKGETPDRFAVRRIGVYPNDRPARLAIKSVAGERLYALHAIAMSRRRAPLVRRR
jgi:peptidoglycan/xylan/chitin deacetylase (PgdA/CDA1 family)